MTSSISKVVLITAGNDIEYSSRTTGNSCKKNLNNKKNRKTKYSLSIF